MISLEEIESCYLTDNHKQVNLKKINLRVESLEKLAIIGKPNSGKTSLLRCINYIDQPKTGIVQFDQMNLTILTKKELLDTRKQIGYVNQNKTLLKSKTVFNNVALPLKLMKISKQDIATYVNEVLSLVNLKEHANCYPKFLTNVQKTLTCLARALITNPKVLICDEITKGFDPRSSYQIIKVLQKIQIRYKLALILATNDLELIKSLCKKVIIIDEGKITEQNTTINFFTSPKTNIGKELIKAKARLELPFGIRKNLKINPNEDEENCSAVTRCSFKNKLNSEIIFSEVIEKFNNKINIISAHQESVDDLNINIMFTQFSGTKENVLKAISHLNENGIHTEVLGYVA